jgi:hypothetical protein
MPAPGPNLLQDGGFEAWTGAGNLTYLTEYVEGATTVNQETIGHRSGSSCLRIDVDASNNGYGALWVGLKPAPDKPHRFSVWYRTQAGKTAWVIIGCYVGGVEKWLNPDGTWGTAGSGSAGIPLAAATSWIRFSISFKTPPAFDDKTLNIAVYRGAAASSSIWFDDAYLDELGPIGYDDLLESPAAERDFLLTVEPKERLRGWTKTGGYAYTYEKPWAPYYADGFCETYRELTGVRENGTALTSQESVALVDANAGSYFQDAVAEKIYVRLTDSGAADRTSIWLVAFFKLFFSSGLGTGGRGKIFDGTYYEPIFSAKSTPAILSEQTDILAGGGLSTGDVTFELANHARFFDRIWTAWSWKNAAVELRHGGEDLPLSEYALIFAGTVKQEIWQPGSVKFDCVNYLELMKRNVPVNPTFGTNVKPEDSGKPLPLLFGEVEGIAPLCTNNATANALEFTIADKAYQQLAAILAVYDGGTLVSAGSYTADLPNCKFAFSDYTPAGQVTCWVQGARIADIPGESSSELMTNASDIVRFFLKRVLGLADTQINTASFADAKAALADLPLAKYVRYRRNLATYLTEIERSTLSVIFQDNDGKIGLAAFNPLFTADTTIRNEEISRFVQKSPADKLYAGVKVYYNATPYERAESGGLEGEDDSYDVSEETNTSSRYLDGETTAYRRIATWLRGQSAADTVRDRVLFLTNRPILEIEMDVAGGRLFTARPGHVLELSKDIAPTTSGALEAQAFRILSISKNIAENRTSVVLDNFAGTAYVVGSWTADAAPAWASATEAERREQGFWTDEDGLVVPGDWSTADKTTWW